MERSENRVRRGDETVVARYGYDAVNRRLWKIVLDGDLDGAQASGELRYYYSDWRAVEERSVAGASESVERQMVYGAYLDELWAADTRAGWGGGVRTIASPLPA